MQIRDLPRLDLQVGVTTPSGRHFRWGGDEPSAANVPGDLSFSSTMPGGFEQMDVTLPRKPGIDYSDLDRLSTLSVVGPGASLAWEGRLERAPRQSGNQIAIIPSAVGWQAHLDDDQSARMVYVDQSSQSWVGMPINRQVAVLGVGRPIGDFDWTTDGGGLVCAMPSTAVANGSTAEIWYIAPSGVTIAKIMYLGSTATGFGEAPAMFAPSDDAGASVPNVAITLDSVLRSVTPADTRRYAMMRVLNNTGASATPTVGGSRKLSKVAVYGNHGLTTRSISSTTPDGLLASDVVTHAVQTWAPLLAIEDGFVQASGFVVPDLKFLEPTTAGEIVRQATAYGLQDWGVWDNRGFHWAARGTFGRKWRGRIAPAQLSETGPQIDRLWNSVMVTYQDVDGTTRTVGPIGSGADTEDATLTDTDPQNPATLLGINRCSLLQMGVTSTAAAAIQVGSMFLAEQKLLDTSGQAQVVGHVTDDRGIVHPAWRVRAGDQISFVDAADSSYRRIVRASYEHGTRTCSIDLDAPPDGLQALLQRLGVVLVPLGA